MEEKDMQKEGDSMKLEENNSKDVKKLLKEEKKLLKEEKKKEKVPMDPVRKKKIIKRSIWGGIAGVVVLFIVISNIAAAGSKLTVYTTAVEKGDIEQSLSTSGTVIAEEVKTYFAPVNVKIGEINVKAGENVAKGDPIITYDAAALENAKKTAQLNLQAAEGNYDSSVQKNNESFGDLNEATLNLDVLNQQITDIDNYIKELQKKVSDKKAALAYEGSLLQISLLDWSDKPHTDEYLNLQKLIQSNTYEQTNNADIRAWQDEITKYTDMLNNCKEYKSEMKSQKNSADGTKLNSGSKAEMEAKAEINNISSKEDLEAISAVDSGLLAEFDGVITEMSAVEGSTPAEGTQLCKLESTQDVKVTISVTKYDLEKLAIGQKAVVTIAGSKYDGEVSKIDKMAVKNSSNTPVVNTDIKILNPDENIYLGVEAKVQINTASVKQTLVVPVSAVNTDMDGDFVYAVENGFVVRKSVVAGISSDTHIEVTEGLKEGDQILSEVSAGITEGMAVTALPAVTAAP